MKALVDSDLIEDDGFVTVYPKLNQLSELQVSLRLKSLKERGIVLDGIPEHGSPQDRGMADAYYKREYDPHWYPNGTYNGARIGRADMTEDQIAQYEFGYHTETEERIED